MRYMMLIYSRETPDPLTPEQDHQVRSGHRAVMQETAQRGIFLGAEPLAPTSTATTVRVQDGRTLVSDGPFAETKEQLAGYYILECANLDEAIEWAARIPTGCKGQEGCIEIRPMPGLTKRPAGPADQAAVNH
ncbi:MAG TPA: YciI family protein [Verrucomicrobiae bacterium]|nr:YciI family protein [Verrucomicrobiae bacterium]